MTGRFTFIAALALAAGAPGAAVAAPARSAAIEIGPKWVVGVAVEADPAAPEKGAKVVAAKAAVTTVGLLDKGRFRPELVAATAADVAELFKRFTQDEKVPTADVRVVAGASLAAVPNRADLEAAIQKTGAKLAYLTAADEARLRLDGLALQKAADWPLVNVGDGDITAAFEPAGEAFGVPFGVVSFTAAARAAAGDTFAAKAAAAAADVAPALAAALRDRTAPKGRTPVTLTGGAAGALVALTKPAAAGAAMVPVTAADVKAFKALLAASPGRFPAVDLSGVAAAARSRAEQDVARVRDAYSAENLVAAAELLDATFAALALDQAVVSFARAGDVALPLAAATPEPVRVAARPKAPKDKEPGPAPKKDPPKAEQPKKDTPKVDPPVTAPMPPPLTMPQPPVLGPVESHPAVGPCPPVGPCVAASSAARFGNPRMGLLSRLRSRR